MRREIFKREKKNEVENSDFTCQAKNLMNRTIYITD